MKMFFVQLSDHNTIHKPADWFEIIDNSIRAYKGDKLVAFVDLGAVLYAHIYEKEVKLDANSELHNKS